MNSYNALAASYDGLTVDAVHRQRAVYLDRQFHKSRLPVETVLDLACGTGTIACLLSEQGYRVVLTRSGDYGLYDEDASNKKAQDMQRRCALIEAEEPLLTVSIHQNSYSDPAVCGPQVFYYQHSAEGKELAALIQEQLNTQLKIARPREIKSNENYYILKRSPSVTALVECSFLSNPEEAAKIQTEEYQEALAGAICDGMLMYLEGEMAQSQGT